MSKQIWKEKSLQYCQLYRKSVGIFLVVVEDVAEVNGDNDAVPEEEGGVADLGNPILDLTQGGESA